MSVHRDVVRVPALFASASLAIRVRLSKNEKDEAKRKMEVRRLPVALTAIRLFDLLVGPGLRPV
jgi:hypothetical protein